LTHPQEEPRLQPGVFPFLLLSLKDAVPRSTASACSAFAVFSATKDHKQPENCRESVLVQSKHDENDRNMVSLFPEQRLLWPRRVVRRKNA
jgi:hypothetical protein